MQKNIYIILTISLLTFSCQSTKFNENRGVISNPISENLKSDFKIIRLEKSIGVIFPQEYEVSFNKERFKNRFTPTEEEIRSAEFEIKKQYLESDRRFNYNQVYKRTEEIYGDKKINKRETLEKLMEPAIKEAKKSEKFDRQYIGFIENGKKIILVQFLDFSKDPDGLKNRLTSEFLQGWHGWFESNVRLKEYDMNKKRLNSFGWSDL